MQLKAPCPKCGKRARYAEAEAGLPAVCHACGTRFTLPTIVAPSSAEDIPFAEPIRDPRATMQTWVWAALAGGVAIGAMVGVIAAVIVTRAHETPPVATTANSTENRPAIPAPPNQTNITPPPAAPASEDDHAEPSPAQPPSSPNPAPRTSFASARDASVAPPAPPALSAPRGPAKPHGVLAPSADGTSAGSSPRPPIRPIVEPTDTLTDARIGKAITDGVNYLVTQLDDKTHELRQNRADFQNFGGGRPDAGAYFGGLDALCVYALLQSGQAIPDNRLSIKSPYMIGLLEQMKKLPNQSGKVVYARAIRATALTLYNRPEDRTAIKGDLEWLLKASQNGAYTYDKVDPSTAARLRYLPAGMNPWDNSCSQYGLLGVWSAAEAGFEVPTLYWKQVEDHWTKNQMPNGEWGYQTPQTGAGRLSMTAAGVASLFVTHDWLAAPKFGNEVGRDPFSPALLKGLDWFENGSHSVDTSTSDWLGYTLYGIERVGLASGFKYFGSHDWYREIARQVIDAQNPNGSWNPQEASDTPYVLLFLARGRHPILMNKLRFDGFWSNRPRDLSNLSRYASGEMEQPVNWQVVPITHDWTDWTDCPILYMASHKAPTLTDEEYDKIRNFIQSGGLLFTQADGDNPEFNSFVEEMSKKLFPDYPLKDLSPDSPLFSVLFHMQLKPKLKAVSNGARLLIVHSPTDLSRAWQLRQQKVAKMPFEFALNLFQYASGRHELRNRLETNVIAAPKAVPSYTIAVARLRYGGNWDPEPYAWTRFSRWFQLQTGYGIDVRPVDMSELTPQAAPIAILTGTDAYGPKPAEVDAVRKYVQAGGVLFVDLAGGGGAFEESARTKLFARAFPNGFLRVLPPDHPLLNTGAPGMADLSHPRLRPFALEKLGSPTNEFPSSFAAGRGHVVFTPLDMTCGLLGTNTWGILGYAPDYSQEFIKNLLLWMVDGQNDQ